MTSLAILGAAIAGRDPARPVVLAGLLRTEAGRFPTDADGAPPPFGPAATAGEPPGAGLRRLLDAINPGSGDARHAIVRAITDLAAIIDRRVELVEIGLTGGIRAIAGPDGLEAPAAFVDGAALVPPGEPDDDLVDGVLAWSSIPLDRHRMRDRLRELRLTPWGEAHGAGRRRPLRGRPGRPRAAGRRDPRDQRAAGARPDRRRRRRLGRGARYRRSPWPSPTSSAGPGRASSPGTMPACSVRSA